VEAVTVLTVCTHNRTRSVMAMAMLQDGFDGRLGGGRVVVASRGFGPEGITAIPEAVAAMAGRGLDVSGHRSRRVTADGISAADLILTAEKDHVVRIAGEVPDAFGRTFTLPEFLERIASDPAPGDRSLGEWIAALSAGRRPAEYLRAEVPEVRDPTGSSRRRFNAAVDEIADACDRVVEAVGRAIGP
jgi:protein-tyrosine phosphatase